jgi:hypothetical protein
MAWRSASSGGGIWRGEPVSLDLGLIRFARTLPTRMSLPELPARVMPDTPSAMRSAPTCSRDVMDSDVMMVSAPPPARKGKPLPGPGFCEGPKSPLVNPSDAGRDALHANLT